jgi:tetratricopeptide (TPR) repeat protein
MVVGMAHRDADPRRALEALRRGLETTRDSGNRFAESHLAHILSGLEAKHGDPLAALDYISLAIRNYQDAGSVAFIHSPLANLAAILDRLGRSEPAATIASFAALSPITAAAFPEINTAIAHLRDVLGEQAYESLARKGEAMTMAVVVAYAYDQIDQALAELKAVSK